MANPHPAQQLHLQVPSPFADLTIDPLEPVVRSARAALVLVDKTLNRLIQPLLSMAEPILRNFVNFRVLRQAEIRRRLRDKVQTRDYHYYSTYPDDRTRTNWQTYWTYKDRLNKRIADNPAWQGPNLKTQYKGRMWLVNGRAGLPLRREIAWDNLVEDMKRPGRKWY